MKRRDFVKTMGVTVAGLTVSAQSQSANKVQCYPSLSWGAIGVSADQTEAINYAAEFGFQGVSASIGNLEQMEPSQRQDVMAMLDEQGLQWGSAGLPVDFRNDEETFNNDIRKLPSRARILREVGVTRVSTYLMPSHSERTYRTNFRIHQKRLKQAAEMLHDEGIRFGLEYVGPKTSWTADRFSFIHTQEELAELIHAIDEENVGYLLDAWHWYTSRGTVDDLLLLSNQDVVDVQINDAPEGLAIDEQQDLSRELPTATGVIDLQSFMQALADIGYDGPVSCEPFNQELNAMDNEAALEETSQALERTFQLVSS